MAVAVSPTADAERAAIVATALDYFEGWFDGDAGRFERALHPTLAKRSPRPPGPLGGAAHDDEGSRWSPGLRRAKARPRIPAAGRRIDVSVVDVYEEIASAVVDSDVYREYLHLVRTGDGWKIVNALWQSS